jgi:hypothetical protein
MQHCSYLGCPLFYFFVRRETYDQFEPVYDIDYYNSIEPSYDQTGEPGILTFDYLKPEIRKKYVSAILSIRLWNLFDGRVELIRFWTNFINILKGNHCIL